MNHSVLEGRVITELLRISLGKYYYSDLRISTPRENLSQQTPPKQTTLAHSRAFRHHQVGKHDGATRIRTPWT